MPKNLAPSYKMDLDLWNCLGKVKFLSQQSFNLVYWGHSRKGKIPSYSRINAVQEDLALSKTKVFYVFFFFFSLKFDVFNVPSVTQACSIVPQHDVQFLR